jgi:outer membrane biosynthesis protein TonB
MSHPILYNKNIKNRVNLKKSFLLSTLIHIFLIFGVSFVFIYKQPLFNSSPVVNIKLANADIDQDPNFLPQEKNPINGNSSESSELIDDQIKQNTLKVKMLDANSDQNTIESKYLNAWQRKIERVGHSVLKKEYPQLDLTQLRLVVSIDSLGNLIETKIIDSSGSLEIDKIAQEIVKLASPFEPFSDEMISEYEVLQVDRIWKFGS